MAIEHRKRTEILDLCLAKINIQHADASVVISKDRVEGSGYGNVNQ